MPESPARGRQLAEAAPPRPPGARILATSRRPSPHLLSSSRGSWPVARRVRGPDPPRLGGSGQAPATEPQRPARSAPLCEAAEVRPFSLALCGRGGDGATARPAGGGALTPGPLLSSRRQRLPGKERDDDQGQCRIVPGARAGGGTSVRSSSAVEAPLASPSLRWAARGCVRAGRRRGSLASDSSPGAPGPGVPAPGAGRARGGRGARARGGASAGGGASASRAEERARGRRRAESSRAERELPGEARRAGGRLRLRAHRAASPGSADPASAQAPAKLFFSGDRRLKGSAGSRLRAPLQRRPRGLASLPAGSRAPRRLTC